MSLDASVLALAKKHLGDFRIRNNQIVADTCPFCNGGPSHDKFTFAIGLYNGAYNCKRGNCNVSGDFRSLLEHFGEKDESIEIPRFIPDKKTYVLPNVNQQPLTDEAEKWFAMRHISMETVNAFHVFCDDKANIVLPFYRDGELVYVKYRNPKRQKNDKTIPKEWSERNTEPILFNMDGCVADKPLIITEGELDAMALYEAGCHNVVSVPCGCNNMEWITLCWDWLEQFNQIILFGDNDEPGQAMINTLLRRLGEERCLTPKEYPEAIYEGVDLGKLCKDANEILLMYGPEFLKAMVEECKPTPVKGVLNLAEVQYIDPATLPRILTKIPELDTCIGGLGEGSVTVFTGKRGEGKSTLNGQLMLNAIEQGYKVCAYSGELSASKFKEWILLQATEARFVDTKIDERTGKVYPMVSSEIQKRINEYIDGKFWLYDNTQIDTAKTQESIMAVFTNCARQFGCKLFVVDNLMVALNAPDQENQAQAKFAAELKNFAVKYKVAVILVAHPRKTKAGEQLTNDDVSGSSAITNLADNVIAVEKPNLNVTKNRDFGELTYIECAYSPINRRIFQVNTGDTFRYSWNHTGIGRPEHPAVDNTSFSIKTGENRAAVNF